MSERLVKRMVVRRENSAREKSPAGHVNITCLSQHGFWEALINYGVALRRHSRATAMDGGST